MGWLRIPDDVQFAHLGLRWDDSQTRVLVDQRAIARICVENGIDLAAIIADGAYADFFYSLLTAWYASARARGEPKNDYMEGLLDQAKVDVGSAPPAFEAPGSTRIN